MFVFYPVSASHVHLSVSHSCNLVSSTCKILILAHFDVIKQFSRLNAGLLS